MTRPEPNPEPRSGIPSVPTGAIHWFYALFTLGTVYLTVANTVAQVAKVNASGWLEIQSIVTVQLLQAAGAAAAGSAILVEGVSMVLAAIIRERDRLKDREESRRRQEEARKQGLEAGREEGWEQGQRENHILWLEWNQRRMDAERDGRAFDEPPPRIDNHD